MGFLRAWFNSVKALAGTKRLNNTDVYLHMTLWYTTMTLLQTCMYIKAILITRFALQKKKALFTFVIPHVNETKIRMQFCPS